MCRYFVTSRPDSSVSREHRKRGQQERLIGDHLRPSTDGADDQAVFSFRLIFFTGPAGFLISFHTLSAAACSRSGRALT